MSDVDDLNVLIERLKQKPQESNSVISKNLTVIAMGVIAACGALIWDTVTSKTPETFSLIQQQTAEIRTTVLEMRSTLSGINERLENNTRQTSEQEAKISSLETTAVSNRERIERVEEEIRGR